MKKEEAKEILTDTKVYTKDKGIEIQEILFSLGFKWGDWSTKICSNINNSYLFIYKEGFFTCSNNKSVFENHKNKEIDLESIISLKSSTELPDEFIESVMNDIEEILNGLDEVKSIVTLRNYSKLGNIYVSDLSEWLSKTKENFEILKQKIEDKKKNG